jgi:hypothetical protein
MYEGFWEGVRHHDLLSFYVIIGRRPPPEAYLNELASPSAFPQLINLMIRKKTIEEIGTPSSEHHNYHAWPLDLVVDCIIDMSSTSDRALFISAVEQRIRRRILSRRIDTEGLLMLQILRAKVLAYP